MKLETAISYAKAGKKVRRTPWINKDAYLHFKDGKLVNQDGDPAVLGIMSFKEDWEVYVEEKHITREEDCKSMRKTVRKIESVLNASGLSALRIIAILEAVKLDIMLNTPIVKINEKYGNRL